MKTLTGPLAFILVFSTLPAVAEPRHTDRGEVEYFIDNERVYTRPGSSTIIIGAGTSHYRHPHSRYFYYNRDLNDLRWRRESRYHSGHYRDHARHDHRHDRDHRRRQRH
jgi:hypothetical protein